MTAATVVSNAKQDGVIGAASELIGQLTEALEAWAVACADGEDIGGICGGGTGGVTLGWALDIVLGNALDLTGIANSLYGLEVIGPQVRWQKSCSL